MLYPLKYTVAILVVVVGLQACKTPVLLVGTEENRKANTGQVYFFTGWVYYGAPDSLWQTGKKYKDIKDFLSHNRRQIRERISDCSCDTVYLDLNDIANNRKDAVMAGWYTYKGSGSSKKHWVLNRKKFFKKAEKKFGAKEYFAAIELFKQAYVYGHKDRKPECLWKIAECYRFIGDVKQAEIMYRKAIAANCTQAEQAKVYLGDSTLLHAYVRKPPSAKFTVTPDTLYSIVKDTNVFVFFKGPNGAGLSPEEIKQLGSLLYPCLNVYKNFLEDIYNYKYQCVPEIGKAGEKLVYVNAFFMEKTYPWAAHWGNAWKESLITVDDGGNYFFHLHIDLQNKICTNFQTNGPG